MFGKSVLTAVKYIRRPVVVHQVGFYCCKGCRRPVEVLSIGFDCCKQFGRPIEVLRVSFDCLRVCRCVEVLKVRF